MTDTDERLGADLRRYIEALSQADLDTPAPPLPGAPTPSRGQRVLLIAAAVVLLAAIGAVVATRGPARTPSSVSTAPHSHGADPHELAAERRARALVKKVVPDHGWVETRSPATAALAKSTAHLTPYTVVASRYWISSADPLQILIWLQTHREPVPSSGPPTPASLVGKLYTYDYQTDIDISILGIKGGGSAIEADAFQLWHPTRLADELAPADTNRATITISGLNYKKKSTVMIHKVIRDKSDVRQLVHAFDSLTVSIVGGRACAGSDIVIQLELAAPKRAPFVVDTCSGSDVSVDGRSLPRLDGSGQNGLEDLEMVLVQTNDADLARQDYLLREPPSVTAQLALPSHSIKSGSTMHAHVVVDNRSGHVIDAKPCQFTFWVTIEGPGVDQNRSWDLMCSHPAREIPKGKSSYPVTIEATNVDGSAIKPGTYQAIIVEIDGPVARTGKPTTIHITP